MAGAEAGIPAGLERVKANLSRLAPARCPSDCSAGNAG